MCTLKNYWFSIFCTPFIILWISYPGLLFPCVYHRNSWVLKAAIFTAACLQCCCFFRKSKGLEQSCQKVHRERVYSALKLSIFIWALLFPQEGTYFLLKLFLTFMKRNCDHMGASVAENSHVILKINWLFIEGHLVPGLSDFLHSCSAKSWFSFFSFFLIS